MVLYQPNIAGSKIIQNIDKYSEIIKYLSENDSKEYSNSRECGYGSVNNGNKKQ